MMTRRTPPPARARGQGRGGALEHGAAFAPASAWARAWARAWTRAAACAQASAQTSAPAFAPVVAPALLRAAAALWLALACATGSTTAHAQGTDSPAAQAPASDTAAQADTLVHDHVAYTRCVNGLGSPAVTGPWPWLESLPLRHATCRCALGADGAAPPGPAGDATSTGQAAVLILGCAAQVLRTGKPDLLLPREQPLWRALALALEPAATTSAAFKPARMRMGEAGCERRDYPAAALRAGAEGATIVSFRVNAEGKAEDAVVVRSAGTTPAHKLLDLATMLTGLGCTFTPASAAGQPVASWTMITYVWRLH